MNNDNITKIKNLREITGISILECKKALIENNFEIEQAVKYLKNTGILKASIKSTRNVKCGLIGITIDKMNKNAVITEINCETDFVAKSNEFIDFVNNTLNYILLKMENKNIYISNNEQLPNDIENNRINLISKLNENIIIKKIKKVSINNGYIDWYIHGTNNVGRIGSIIIVDKFNNEYLTTYKDLVMQITAMNPKYLNKDIIPKEEKNIIKDLDTFITEHVLLEQKFIKDNKKLIKDIINNKFNILDFIRFEVGEI